MTKVSSGLII